MATRKGALAKSLSYNWKPKLVCLLLAVLVWVWVEYRYVQDASEWDLNDVRLSVPEFNN